MSITNQLIERYGMLMTIEELAELIRRTPNSLRVSLSTNTELARHLSHAKVRLGRRVLFQTHLIAKVLEGMEPVP